MTDRELLQQALEALESAMSDSAEFGRVSYGECLSAITALREKLAHCDRCGKKLGGPDHIHTCSPQVQVQGPVACQPRGLIDIGRVFTPEKAEEPKPVAWKKKGAFHFCNQPPVDVEKWIPLYKSHTQHWQTWAGLTDEELREIEKEFQAERVRTSDEEYLIIYPSAYWSWMKAIEAKLKEKNT